MFERKLEQKNDMQKYKIVVKFTKTREKLDFS